MKKVFKSVIDDTANTLMLSVGAQTTPTADTKLYSIQDIRDMIGELSNDMNPYKFIDNAEGFNTIQEFLASIQIRDMNA